MTEERILVELTRIGASLEALVKRSDEDRGTLRELSKRVSNNERLLYQFMGGLVLVAVVVPMVLQLRATGSPVVSVDARLGVFPEKDR